MKKTIFILLLCMSTSFGVYLFLKPNENALTDQPGSGTTAPFVTTSSKQLNNYSPTGTDYRAESGKVEIPLKNIVDLNDQLDEDFSLQQGSKLFVIDDFMSKQRENTDDVIELIENYNHQVKEYRIETEKLITKCWQIDTNVLNQEEYILAAGNSLNPIIVNEYYFLKGLKESEFCSRLGTDMDPFYFFLDLARSGDYLSQLLLIDSLMAATKRNLINIYQEPLQYQELRDEAVTYLKALSAKGVSRASERLARLYSGTEYLTGDKVLEYYYYYLANKQNSLSGAKTFRINLNMIYKELSEKQKLRIDRMIQRV